MGEGGRIAGVVVALALVHVAMARREHDATLAKAPVCPEAEKLGGACARCVAAYCCAAISACYASPACIDLNDCTVECGEEVDEAGCPARCASRASPETRATFTAWNVCAHERCARECPRGDGD